MCVLGLFGWLWTRLSKAWIDLRRVGIKNPPGLELARKRGACCEVPDGSRRPLNGSRRMKSGFLRVSKAPGTAQLRGRRGASEANRRTREGVNASQTNPLYT